MKGSKKSATAPLLRGCFTGYNKMKNRDVQLCGTAWLHPEIPFCTQTGLSICKATPVTNERCVIFCFALGVVQREVLTTFKEGGVQLLPIKPDIFWRALLLSLIFST